MKKRIIACSLAVLAAVLMTGCGKDTGMVDAEAVAVESDLDLSGRWICPGRDFSMVFGEDGTVTEKEKLSTTEGTYQFMSQNAAFTIGSRFEHVEYISCTDDKDKVFYTGAVLGDLISGYNEVQKMERYYLREDRAEIPAEDIIGSWEDVNSSTYYAILNEDGSLKTTDWEGTYEIENKEEYGTTLTFHFEDYDEEYAVVPYEKYLFLYRTGTSNVYQLQPREDG